MEIILSTRNPSKAEQIKAIFSDPRFSVRTLDEAGIEGEVVEDGSTLAENAMKKAMFAHRPGGEWSMADDTGFFLRALDGRPGIHAARWAGETATTEEITRFTLKELEGKSDRSGVFETVVALVSPSGVKYFFKGTVEGKVLESPRVPAQPKMPYSPIFVPDGTDMVWAEMTVEYENGISHRGKAFRQALEFLKSKVS